MYLNHIIGCNFVDETCNASNAEINIIINNICNDSDVDDQPHSTLIGNLPSGSNIFSIFCYQSSFRCILANISLFYFTIIDPERSPYHTPNMAKNAAAVTHVEETQQGEDTVTILPFAKKSPYWETCESMEGFKSVPQRPHFTPLIEGAKEDLREWSAVGMMVTFYGLLDKVKDLKLDDPPSKLHSLSDSFAELEKHGFDVEAPELRISKMLSLQNDQRKSTEEKKCLEKKIEEEENETRNVEEELAELKLRMLELQRLEAVAKKKKQAGDEKIVEMKSSVVMIEQKLEEVEIEFEKTVLAPW